MPLSINEAVKAGVERLQLDNWALSDDHIKITIVNDPETGERWVGPWYELWSPMNEDIHDHNPTKNLIIGELGLGDLDACVWTIYAPVTR
jgi:hypothetical protein